MSNKPKVILDMKGDKKLFACSCKKCKRSVVRNGDTLYLIDRALELREEIKFMKNGFVNYHWSLNGDITEKLERLCIDFQIPVRGDGLPLDQWAQEHFKGKEIQ